MRWGGFLGSNLEQPMEGYGPSSSSSSASSSDFPFAAAAVVTVVTSLMVTFPVDDSKSTSRLLLGGRRWMYSSAWPLVPWILITISAFVLTWLLFSKSGSSWLSSQWRILSFREPPFDAAEAWPNADIDIVGSFLGVF